MNLLILLTSSATPWWCRLPPHTPGSSASPQLISLKELFYTNSFTPNLHTIPYPFLHIPKLSKFNHKLTILCTVCSLSMTSYQDVFLTSHPRQNQGVTQVSLLPQIPMLSATKFWFYFPIISKGIPFLHLTAKALIQTPISTLQPQRCPSNSNFLLITPQWFFASSGENPSPTVSTRPTGEGWAPARFFSLISCCRPSR